MTIQAKSELCISFISPIIWKIDMFVSLNYKIKITNHNLPNHSFSMEGFGVLGAIR